MLGTAGLQDNDIALKNYLVGSYLSSSFIRILRTEEKFLRFHEALAYGLSYLQKLG